MPAGTFQWSACGGVEVIPIAGTVFRVAHATIPAMPAGTGISVFIKKVPMMVNSMPCVGWITAVRPTVPPAVIVLYSASTFFRNPGFHEHLRSGVYLFDSTGGTSPVRQLEMGIIHNGFPVPAPSFLKISNAVPH